MTPDDYKALVDEVLCQHCGGLLRLPEFPVPASLLRWCICDLRCSVPELGKERIGFAPHAKRER